MSNVDKPETSSENHNEHTGIEYPLARMKMEELFVQWLAQRDTSDIVQRICTSVQIGEPVTSPPIPPILSSLFGVSSSPCEVSSPDRRIASRSGNGTPPPRSPTHRQARPLSPRSGDSNHSSMHHLTPPQLSPDSGNIRKALDQAANEIIPVASVHDTCSKSVPRLPLFYCRGEGGRGRGRRIMSDSLSMRRVDIETIYEGCGEGGANEILFMSITKDIIGLPGLVNGPLMRRINQLYDPQQTEKNQVQIDALTQYWLHEIEPFDVCERFFRLCKKPTAEVVMMDDLCLFVSEVLLFHPGLAFLNSHAEFMEKYALTVSTRIMYSANLSRSGFLTEKEMRRAGVLRAWQIVDLEEDINRCTLWFSYEHFYVLYCRFWELDTDHDGQVSRDDLLRYGGHRLSRVIVDHIFDLGHRPGTSKGLAKRDNLVMKYDDFVYFMLSEEDKGNFASLSYWFTCVDGDGDGVITPMDMKVFYDVQSARMEALGHEVVSFEDILCQMNDMISPMKKGCIVLTDLLRTDLVKHAGVVFDALFNLEKFVSFEQRDPFAERHKRDDPFECDWDRFAYAEYNRLAQEEEAREEMELDNSQLGEWGDTTAVY